MSSPRTTWEGAVPRRGRVPSYRLCPHCLGVVAAGTAALASAFSALEPFVVPVSIAFVILIAYMNLRAYGNGQGVRTSDLLLPGQHGGPAGMGLFMQSIGHLPVLSLHHNGLVKMGKPGDGCSWGQPYSSYCGRLRPAAPLSPASKAISNGVPAFSGARVAQRPNDARLDGIRSRRHVPRALNPGRRHARRTVRKRHTDRHLPDREVRLRNHTARHLLFFALQAGTTLILVLAANTSFADFPRLASFAAADSFSPASSPSAVIDWSFQTASCRWQPQRSCC